MNTFFIWNKNNFTICWIICLLCRRFKWYIHKSVWKYKDTCTQDVFTIDISDDIKIVSNRIRIILQIIFEIEFDAILLSKRGDTICSDDMVYHHKFLQYKWPKSINTNTLSKQYNWSTKRKIYNKGQKIKRRYN